MAKKTRSRPRGRAMTGGGAGFIFPAFGASLDASSLVIFSDEDTVIGNLTPTPADGQLTLLDSDGNRFKLVGNVLKAGSVASVVADQPTQNITVRNLWGGRTQDFVIPITLADPSIALSGSHTIAHDAATNTLVGNLTAIPTGAITYSIVTQDTVNGFKIVTAALEKDSGTTTAGSYNITIRATKGSNHWDQAFVLTLT